MYAATILHVQIRELREGTGIHAQIRELREETGIHAQIRELREGTGIKSGGTGLTILLQKLIFQISYPATIVRFHKVRFHKVEVICSKLGRAIKYSSATPDSGYCS